jgi:RNA polymerase sigma factor (TIGR02999 family)
MLQTQQAEITLLLRRSRQGDREALEELAPIIYEALRQLARRHLQRERDVHTLQPTALLNEAWMRLFNSGAQEDQATPEWHDRFHFLAVASRQMRQVCVDHARAKKAVKRDGKRRRVGLTEAQFIQLPRPVDLVDLLALDEALDRLAEELPRAAQMVELRYFGGLTEEETAEALGISLSTLKRDWKFAQVWLYDRLRPNS